MAKVIEATVVWNGSNYALNPNVGEHEGMDIADWLTQTRQDYEVRENTDLQGRVQGAGARTIYRCAQSDQEYTDVAVWEEED